MESKDNVLRKAYLYSAIMPGEERQKQLLALLSKKYGGAFSLEWIKEDLPLGAVRLEAAGDTYSFGEKKKALHEKKAETAVILSAVKPSDEMQRRFGAFLEKKYGAPIPLTWKEDAGIPGGFRLVIGADEYVWSPEENLKQLTDEWKNIRSGEGKNVIPLLKESLKNWAPKAQVLDKGRVITVGDGIATVAGLQKAFFGEILVFEGGVRGMVMDISREKAGCIIFGDDAEIEAGSCAYRTERVAGMPVGDGFVGRVIDALGNPVDGQGEIKADDYRALETPAPAIIDRQPVNEPLETGMLVIDSMFPIGRGQRELIIGDRQTGKTSIAIDTIINQRGKNVICIYVAIGQKTGSVAHIADILKKHGAMDYSIIVNAGAGDGAPYQYIAPYAGCALGEYFMYKGRDVLIVYDDLSKHAVAYRELSLLLERSPGREAFPGDVFYLHSRLLERSAHLSDERGGGSITALPIVETQAGDVSAYIPTNVISITDGQIFLETNLFAAGQRPAVNVGLSVSRVGGDAQTKNMKKAAGTLRLDLAQYRELEVFTQFSSDLDESTKRRLSYGQGLTLLLRQKNHHPLPQRDQIILLICAMEHMMEGINADAMPAFKEEMLAYVNGRENVDALLGSSPFEETKERIIALGREFLESRAKA